MRQRSRRCHRPRAGKFWGEHVLSPKAEGNFCILFQCCWHGWAWAGCRTLPLICCTSLKNVSFSSIRLAISLAKAISVGKWPADSLGDPPPLPRRNTIAFHHYICTNMAIPAVFNWPKWCIFPPNMSWIKSNAFLPGTGAICSGAAAGKSTPADQLISASQQHMHRIQMYIGNELHNFPWHSMISGNTGVFRKIMGSPICGGQKMDPNTKMPESSATSVEPCSWTGLSFEGEVSHGELAFGATLVFRVLKEITLIII